MPDENRLLSALELESGTSLQIIDVETGEIRPLFEINLSAAVAVSPDGKRLAFEEQLPLEKYGLFVANLDGSNRKMLSDGDPYVATSPTWSPDANWLIVTVHDLGSARAPNWALALIRVDTCQILPLRNLSGYVSSWIP
jgi:Tol biopolymer transport system component